MPPGAQIQRTADLTGASGANLNFGYASANLTPGDTVVVQASSTGTGGWNTLATFTGGIPDVAPPYDISAYISANTTIRFWITGGFDAVDKTFSVDNVDITYGTSSTFAAGGPPNFLSSATGCLISPDNSLTLTYDVTVDNPLATGINRLTNTAYVNSNEMILPLSAAVTNIVVNPASGSAEVGDRVWLDANGNGALDVGEPGLANVEVTLKDQFGTPIMTTTTDATGHYLFSGVEPGSSYHVEVTSGTLPAGLLQSAPAGHSDNLTGTFNLAAGQSYRDADLGYTSAAGKATIGNYVWSDANADNRRNSGEAGISGVTVELWRDVNGDGLKDAGDLLCTSGACGAAGTTTTAPDGSYLFTGVTASGTQDYIVYIDEIQTTLSGYTRTSPPSGSALFSVIDISSGTSIVYANFGYQGTTYSIKDQLWFDAGNFGVLDDGEPGISGVTVDLLDASLNVLATATTAADGTFTFTGVADGGADYTIKITDTGGKLTDYFGTTASAQAGSKQVINLTGDVDIPSPPSFGYNLSRAIGDTVFNDNGAGGGTLGDGVQNGSEPGIPGVTVLLYRDNGNGIFEPGTGDGASIATFVTDSDGRYLFAGLSTGTYWVQIDNSQAALSSYTLTTSADHLLVTMSGSTNLGIDFGYRASTPGSISGGLWEDADKDGVMDSGEPGIAGVTVDLYRDSNANGVYDQGADALVATTASASDGSYSFNGVPSGTSYYVRITDNDGVLTGYTPDI